MYDKMIGILADKIVLSLVLTFIITQLFKFLTSSYKEGRINLGKFVEGGGMPSSHSSIVSALTISIFLYQGFSPLAVAVFIFSLIVVRDSFGVRKHAGIHAKVLNILKNTQIKKALNKKDILALKNIKLQENIGHRPIETIAGVLLGAAISIIVWLV